MNIDFLRRLKDGVGIRHVNLNAVDCYMYFSHFGLPLTRSS